MGAALSRIREPRLNELQAHDAIKVIVRRYKKAIVPADYALLFRYHAQLRAQVLRILPGRLDNVRTIHVEEFSVVKDVGKDYAKQLILNVGFDDGVPSQRWSFNLTHQVKELTHTLPAYKVFYDAVDLMPFFSRKKADSIKKCVIDDLSQQFPTILKRSAGDYAARVDMIQQKIAMKLFLIGCQIPDGRRPQLARLKQLSAGRYLLTINLINTVAMMSEAIVDGRTVSCKGEWISIAVEDFGADISCIQEAEEFTFEGLNIMTITAEPGQSHNEKIALMRNRRGGRGGGSSAGYGSSSSASNP